MPVITIQFPANISVTNLNGLNGFPVIGFPSNSGGAVVGKAGDVNADGIADLVIGTPSADDLDNSANNPNLVFSVSNVKHGYFALTSSPTSPITAFTQQQVQTGKVQFVHDGSINPPSYNITVVDGASKLTAQAAQSLQKAIEGGETDVEKQQTTHYREVVRPVTNKVFEKVNTTGFLGYRSEQDAKGYIEAIQRIIANLESLGINMNFKSLSAPQRDLIINEIAKQTKHVAGKKYRCCTTDYVCRFFKAEVTPQELDNKASQIAYETHKALSTSVTVRPLSSPVADDARVATLELSEMSPMQIPAG